MTSKRPQNEQLPAVDKMFFPGQWFVLSGLSLLLVIGFVIATSQRQPAQISTPESGRMLTASGKRAHYPHKVLEVTSAQQVWDYFAQTGYTMANLQAGNIDVPRIYLTNIVNTWSKNQPTEFKKDLFFRSMLPLILRTNELILEDRAFLLELDDKNRTGHGLTAHELAWLQELAVTYRLSKRDRDEGFNLAHFPELLNRVDAIPVSMAVAQTAYESAYATSRFAGEGNSLFGQWRWGSGLVPKNQRGNLGDYRIADFDTPLHSAIAFARNLNTNNAYREFRQKRAKLRQQGKELDGLHLATTLHRYSERGQTYVNTVQRIIQLNKLSAFDHAKLGSGEPISLVPNWPEESS